MTAAGAVWTVLSLFKVDLAILWAFITFLLNPIPHLGYAISILLPLPIIWLDPSKTSWDLFSCILWPIVIHQVVNAYAEQHLMSETLELHPILMLFAFVFWFVMWGLWGAIISTPLTCLVKVALIDMNHPLASFIAELMQDLPTIAGRKGEWLRGLWTSDLHSNVTDVAALPGAMH